MTGVMPLRGGSKGIPRKNIKDFLGKPLFYWNMSALVGAEMRVYADTDDDEIADLVKWYFGDEVTVFRGVRHSDTSTTIEIVQEFIEKLDLPNDELFVLSQATSPYLRTQDILDMYYMMRIWDSVLTCGRTHRFLWEQGETTARCINFPGKHKRRQDWEGTPIQNGCAYMTTVGMIRETALLWGGNLGLYFQDESFELDSPEDWAFGEARMGRFYDYSS